MKSWLKEKREKSSNFLLNNVEGPYSWLPRKSVTFCLIQIQKKNSDPNPDPTEDPDPVDDPNPDPPDHHLRMTIFLQIG